MTVTAAGKPKNDRRVAAGRQNALKRRPWTAEERLRLAQQCRLRQPWRQSTGPRTEAGKSRSAMNGRMRLADPNSARQVRAIRASLRKMMRQLEVFHNVIAAEFDAAAAAAGGGKLTAQG